jgi:hypothetical protein
MSLQCSIDSEGYIEIFDTMIISAKPCKCVECKKEIPPGDNHYFVRLWREADESDWEGLTDEEIGDSPEEITLGEYTACEECGDLAASVLEKGYCWAFGSLRDDISETINEQGHL